MKTCELVPLTLFGKFSLYLYPITFLLCKLWECWALCGLSDGVMQCPRM